MITRFFNTELIESPPSGFIDKFENTYRVHFSTIRQPLMDLLKTTTYEFIYIEVGEYILPYTISEDMLISGRVHSFLLWDDVFDYTNILKRVKRDVPIVYDLTPVSKLHVKDLDVEEWVKSIPVRSSYLSGRKYQMLTIRTKIIPFDRILPLYSDFFILKDDKYKIGNHIAESVIVYHLYQTKEVYSISGYDEGMLVFSMLCYVRDGRMMGYFIHVTEDIELKKKHRGYLLGHVEAVRLAKKLGIDTVEFGLHLHMKKDLNFNVEWRPGVNIT
jgi:hypothetical protein